jgi:hypothetical protein
MRETAFAISWRANMDPLDQRLTDDGTAWRRAQPAPPDLDRLVRGLDRRRSRALSPRLGLVFVGALLIIGAVAAASGAGGIFNRSDNNGVSIAISPSPLASPRPSEAAATATPTARPSASTVSDPARATALLDSYEAALVAGKWHTAFDMLAPASLTRGMGEAAFAAERAPYFESVGGRYTIGAPKHDADWTQYAPLIEGADTSRAYLLEVDYPALSGNNAGFELYVVAPDSTGTWRIWPAR